MKNIFTAFVVLISLASTSAHSAPGTIDLGKFVHEANTELEKTYGAQNLESDGKLYFQDGVGSVGMPVLSDFATLTWIRKPKFTPESPDLMMGYRLELNGTTGLINTHFFPCQAPICQSPGPDSISIGFTFPGTVLFGFQSGTSLSTLESISKQIKSAFPSANTTILEFIYVIQVDAHPLDIPQIVNLMSSEKSLSGFDLNFETYAYPIEFDSAKELKDLKAVIDLDQIRTISNFYKKQGVPFVTETTVPPRFAP